MITGPLFRRPLIRALTADKHVRSPLLNALGIQLARQVIARALLRLRYLVRNGARRDPDFAALVSEGLLVIPSFLPKDEFERLRQECFAALDDPGVSKTDFELGPTVLRMLHIKAYRDRLPIAEAVSSSPRLMRLLGAAEGKTLGADQQHRVIERVFHGSLTRHDPENELHIDTFHSTHKVWLYLDDVKPENGPLAVVPRSHRIDRSVLRRTYRYFRDIDKSQKSPSRRIDQDEVVERGLRETALTVPANTLVIANTGGYHRRLRGTEGATRTAVHVSVRTQPFVFWVVAGGEAR